MSDLHRSRPLSACRLMLKRSLVPLLIPMVMACARPYSGRVAIAEETLLQASERAIPYAAMLDAAIDGPPAAFTEFIRLMHQLDTAGRYFHAFHVYEVAEKAGDSRFAVALEALNTAETTVLAKDLFEAKGWLKRSKTFAAAFPRASAVLRARGIKVDF